MTTTFESLNAGDGIEGIAHCTAAAWAELSQVHRRWMLVAGAVGCDSEVLVPYYHRHCVHCFYRVHLPSSFIAFCEAPFS